MPEKLSLYIENHKNNNKCAVYPSNIFTSANRNNSIQISKNI